MFDEIKQWWKNQQKIAQAKSHALNAAKLETMREEAKIDNAIRLQRKKNRLAAMQNQPKTFSKKSSHALSPFVQKTNTKTKGASGGSNPSGGIMNLEF